MSRRLRDARRLAAQFLAYAHQQRQWWLVAVAIVLAALTALIVAGHAAAPYTLYTLF